MDWLTRQWFVEPPPPALEPELTALPRHHRPSSFVVWVARNVLPRLPTRRVLDHGCGHGRHLVYLRARGYEVDGYDPFLEHHATAHRAYGLAISVGVLNVIPGRDGRVAALRWVSDRLAPDGLVALSVPSRKEFLGHVGACEDVTEYGDGAIVGQSVRSGTKVRRAHVFQKGFDLDEVLAIAEAAGLAPHPRFRPERSRSQVRVVLRKDSR